MYYLYHIPGKKIGVTCNLNRRVTLTQGYGPDEYEVLDQSDDIDYISEKEIELQQSYGYKVDRKKYNELVKLNKFKMNINVTEQTTTFPYPIKKLKGNLMDNIGFKWKSEHGDFILSLDSIRWIMKNVKTSMYNDNRSYVYNKAFAEWFKTPELWSEDQLDEIQTISNDRFELIRDWARSRGLYDKGNSHTQYVKLQEEAGELAKALLKNDKPEVVDAIGDMVVVLTNLAFLQGVDIEHCIDSAYKVISKRKGKMINGTFVKDE